MGIGAYQIDDGTGGADTPANRAIREPELFLRMLQSGSVSASFRTHCSHCELRPWMYPNFAELAPVYRFRSTLVPYIYTCAAAAYRTGVLMVHPVYYEWPLHEEAYANRGQYMFGPSMLVAPV